MKIDGQVVLVRKAKKGDAQAFVKLCELYQVVLYNSAYKILLNEADVADCLQETELRAWKKIPTLKNEGAFNTWIFKIMLNKAKDMLKQRVEAVALEEDYFGVEEVRYEYLIIDDSLNQLAEKYRIPLVLYYYSGFSIKEIANQLKMSSNTVKTRLARGREQLKKIMEEPGNG